MVHQIGFDEDGAPLPHLHRSQALQGFKCEFLFDGDTKRFTKFSRARAEENMSKVEVTNDAKAAVQDADVIYTDVFVSMGQDKERAKRLAAFLPDFQVNESLVKLAAPHSIVMHCLPAHRDEEITDRVIEGSHSVVWDQAENRLHTEKAVLALLL